MYIIYTLTNLIIIIRLVFSTEKLSKKFCLAINIEIIRMLGTKRDKQQKKEREKNGKRKKIFERKLKKKKSYENQREGISTNFSEKNYRVE
jgi:hypothetical protein